MTTKFGGFGKARTRIRVAHLWAFFFHGCIDYLGSFDVPWDNNIAFISYKWKTCPRLLTLVRSKSVLRIACRGVARTSPHSPHRGLGIAFSHHQIVVHLRMCAVRISTFTRRRQMPSRRRPPRRRSPRPSRRPPPTASSTASSRPSARAASGQRMSASMSPRAQPSP